MTEIIKSLIEILSAPNLRSLILTHLGDLMSGLLQVIHAGRLKMPVKGVPKEKSNMNQSEEFVMTEEWYKQLVEDRNQFKIIYKELIDNIYKPLVIKELLILLAPTKNIVSGEIIPPPSWLRRAISSQLTEYLISPGGVSLIMRAMCESCSDSVDWKKAEVISKLISTVHGNLSDDEFYAKISPQVISLLNTTGPYCIPVAKNCIRNIYYHNVEICNKYIFDKLFEPFIICSKSVNKNFDGTLVSEDSLSRCIDHLTKCFATGSETSFVPVSVLLKIIKIVFQLYMKVAQSSYQHKTAIQNLLIEFLYSEKDKKNLTQIYNCLIFKEQHSDILEMNEDLEFQFGPSGGIQVSKSHKQSSPLFPEFELEYEIAGDQILELLSQRQDYSKKLVSDLFVILLSSLSDFHDQKIEMSNNNVDLLSGEDLIFFVIKVSQKRIITIKLLAVLAENVYVMETVQEKPEIVFKFVENLLDSKAKDFIRDKETESSKENDEESQEDEFKEDSNKYDTEDLLVALAVVDLITVNVKLNSDRWDTCKSLLLSLEIIKDNCEDNYIKYFSDVLHKRILSRGAVLGSKKPRTGSLNTQMMFNKNSKNNEAREGKIEQKKEAELKSQKSKKNKKLIVEVNENGDEKSEIDIALEEVCSEDVPTRGHAIIQLGKLIRKKNNDALLKKEYIFSVLKCNLKHDDSYIYLSAINALEALGGTGNSDQILELLCNEYTDNKKDSSEIQMKIGEVLMRITRGLGEVVPKYKALLINTLLFGTKSSDELLRVSSLSNLGELLKILGYGIGSILQEVGTTFHFWFSFVFYFVPKFIFSFNTSLLSRFLYVLEPLR